MMMALGYVVMCRRPKAVKFGQNCKILAKNCKVVHPIKKGREESREFSKTQKIGTNFSNSFHFSRKSSFKQCDQIGPFLERLGNKISFKSGPNFWWLLGLFQTTSFLVKNVRGYFLVNFVNKYWATFSNIWSHWFRTKKFVHFFLSQKLLAKSRLLSSFALEAEIPEKKLSSKILFERYWIIVFSF